MTDPPGVLVPALVAYPRIEQWLSIDAQSRVTIFSGKVEVGQGIRTALVQLVADELGVVPGRVSVAPADTDHSPDEGITSGSRSIEESNRSVRRAAAEARRLLLLRAAERLAVPSDDLRVEDGCVIAPRGDRVTFGELVDPDLLSTQITGQARLTPAADLRLIGTSLPRVDLPGKLEGAPVFVNDFELPGMVHGRIARPPNAGARLLGLDVAQVRAMAGILEVVRDGSFVGVVAEREEQAIGALKRLRRIARWADGDAPRESRDFLLAEPSEEIVVHAQEAAPDRSDAVSELHGQYSRPYLAHASLAPSCAVARFADRRFEVWSNSQGIYHLRQELAKVLGVEQRSVRVVHVEGAGCYGASGADDAALDAALLARGLPGRPVRVQWMRDDEFAWEPYGTPMVVRLRAGVDAAGSIVEWNHRVWGNGHRDRRSADGPPTVTNLLAARHLARALQPSVAPAPPNPLLAGGSNAAPIYDFPNQRIVNHYVPRTPVRVSALRSLGAHINVFAIESFMDEIAESVGADPVAHRLRYLTDPRASAVIERVAAGAAWPRRGSAGSGTGLGIGFARYKNTGAYVAVAAEVEIGDDLQLTRVWVAVDPGLAVNPDGVVNQAEGGVLQAASWTLKEEVTFRGASVASRGWDTYPILRFGEAPEVHVTLVSRRDQPPAGVGEAFAGPTAGAIGNALYQATGVRVRDMPFTRERIARAMA